MLLRFPDTSDGQDAFVVNELREWLWGDAMRELLGCFGFQCHSSDLGTYLHEASAFVAKEFDYMAKTREFASRMEQALSNHDIAWLNDNLSSINLYLERLGYARENDGVALVDNAHREELLQHMRLKERFVVCDDVFLLENRDKFSRLIEEIGTPGTEELVENGKREALKSSWIVILGATAGTNQHRTLLAKQLYDLACIHHPINVIGLAGERIVQRNELVKAGLDVDAIMSEYDSLKECILHEFKPSRVIGETCSSSYLHQQQRYGNDYRKWDTCQFWGSSRKTTMEDKGNAIIVMSCPSSDPSQRRANTYDTIDLMIQECLDHGNRDRLLLVGSARYAAYTIFTTWLKYKVERRLDNISFAFTGNVGSISNKEMIASYLMEIKNGINAGKILYETMREKNII